MYLVGKIRISVGRLGVRGSDRPSHNEFSGIEVVVGSRRTLILVGALVIGAIAAVLIFQYVGGIEEKAQGDVQMVNVVIAKAPITKGTDAATLLGLGSVGLGKRRASELPSNAVTRVEEIKGQLSQLDIQPGTIITSSMFSSDAVGSSNSVSTALKTGMVAVTTSSDAVKSVAGLISQGDYVNLTMVGSCTTSGGVTTLASADAAASPDAGAAGGQTANVKCAGSLFQKVRILAIGRSLGSSVSAPVATDAAATPTTLPPTSDMITFEVPPEAAQIIQLAGPGSLYMTLVRRDYVPAPIAVTPYIPLGGVQGQTPYGADPEIKTAGQ